MRPDLENTILSRWPKWFDVEGDVKNGFMRYGFQCGDGWFEIICSLCERLEPLVNCLNVTQQEQFRVLQAKQKLGGLRFYVSQRTPAIELEIGCACEETIQTCENCGRLGAPQTVDGLLITLCVNCHDQLQVKEPNL